ncbi:MAG TPA: ABC transporter permease, partial [Bryobacteraceae bacterium]|nr:ABC transporter permease [Bryobacteraceae bacterium]
MMKWLRRNRAREIHEEVESHLEMRAEWNQQAGVAPEEARAAARRQLGNAALLEEDVRRVHALPWFETIGQDLRYALRGFRRSPVFTVTAALTIALGIGASSAVFSVVDRILFRPLPYLDAGRLVSFGMVAPSADKNEFLMAENYVRLRARQTAFASFTSFGFISPCDLTEQNAARLQCAMVESTFLPTFGIQPVLGRNFTKQEDRPGAPKVALLSYSFWRSRFNGDRGTIGRTILVDAQPTAIIGVLPRDFELFNLTPFDLLIPEAIDEARPGNGRAFRVFARLKPGVSLQQAREAMLPLFEDERRTIPPEFRGEVRMVIRPLRDRQIADVRTASWTLFGAVMVVLLIACGNVANLMLARSASRRRELAIRAAIGAGRARLVRQNITESLLLAGLGAVAGCGLAWALIRFFVAVAPNGITRLDHASLDSRVLLFAVALSIASGVLFGSAATVESPSAGMLAAGRGVVSARGLLRHVLIAAQIAASLILLSGASLLLRSLWNLEKVPLGMDTDHAVAAHFVLGGAYQDDAKWRGFFD